MGEARTVVNLATWRCPAAARKSGRVIPADPVHALQSAPHLAAKADPGRRFHALFDQICRRDALWRAWVKVRWNNGAPGIDKAITFLSGMTCTASKLIARRLIW
jgi:hypothetical protein